MSLVELMQQLNQRLGLIQPPQLDAHGRYHLQIDKKLHIDWQQHTDEVILSSTIQNLANASPQQLETTLKTALQYSLAISKQRAEIISFDTESKTLLLYRKFKLERILIDRLLDELGAFLNHLERWHDRLSDRHQPAPPMSMLLR